MAIRSEMNSLVAFSRRLASNISSSSISDEDIQTELDAEKVYFNYVRLFADSDYHVYASVATQPPKRTVTKVIKAFTDLSHPDFSAYYKAGFFGQTILFRSGVTDTDPAYTPTVGDFFSGTFSYATAPNLDLYLVGFGYNPYRAAATILEQGLDTGGRDLRSVSRGQISYGYEPREKRILSLRTQGYYVNRMIPRWERG